MLGFRFRSRYTYRVCTTAVHLFPWHRCLHTCVTEIYRYFVLRRTLYTPLYLFHVRTHGVLCQRSYGSYLKKCLHAYVHSGRCDAQESWKYCCSGRPGGSGNDCRAHSSSTSCAHFFYFLTKEDNRFLRVRVCRHPWDRKTRRRSQSQHPGTFAHGAPLLHRHQNLPPDVNALSPGSCICSP